MYFTETSKQKQFDDYNYYFKRMCISRELNPGRLRKAGDRFLCAWIVHLGCPSNSYSECYEGGLYMMHPWIISLKYIYKHIGKNHVSVVTPISIGILSAFSIKMRKSVYQPALGSKQ